jgi:alanine racemase
LVRPGLALYGAAPYLPLPKGIVLQPVLSFKTQVVFVKTMPAGSSVSYARTWTAARASRIATLAVGYADGLPRLLSNRGEVLIRGHRAAIVGRVTMDMTMVDVTDVPDASVGDEVVLLGVQGEAEIRAAEWAAWADTNPYEILCGVSARVPRLVING